MAEAVGEPIGSESMMSQRTILIVTGEASGDLHGGELARALLRREPRLRLQGMGGEKMKAAGVELIFDNRQLGVMGLTEVFGRWRTVLRAFGAVKRILDDRTIDLVVLIDAPDFNLRVARLAKRRGLPTVYYIGPKIWAWRAGRLKTIKKWVDRMMVIFPFEERLYRDAGVPCEYVGHPLMDEIPASPDRGALRRRYGIPEAAAVVALLPGSRDMEVGRLLDGMLEAFRRIRADFPTAVGLVPVAPSLSISKIQSCRPDSGEVRWVAGEAPEVLACADAAIIASGTATLEAAIVGTPMVVVYKVAGLTALVGRLLIKIPNVGLVNIVAGRRIATELLQAEATPEAMAAAVSGLLRNPSAAREQKKALEAVRASLGPPGAARRAADGILKQLSQSNRTVAA